MCEERKWKKDIHILLADMKYIDSCIDVLQKSDLGRAYFSDYEKAANILIWEERISAIMKRQPIC